MEVIEEPGERRDEVVELVVLLLDRPLKTESRFGLWVWAWAIDLERIWAKCSWGSLEERVDGGSLCPSSSQDPREKGVIWEYIAGEWFWAPIYMQAGSSITDWFGFMAGVFNPSRVRG